MTKRNKIIHCLILAALVLVSACTPAIPDGKIQSDIAQKLTSAGINKVSIVVLNGAVTLTGEVPYENLRQQVDVLAKSVEGVKSVQSSVIVVAPTPEPTIESEVAKEPTSLQEEAQLEAENYWNKFIFNCGESDFMYSHRPAVPKSASRYYDQPLDIYYEMRNLSISTDGDTPNPRSEADRLNEQSSPTGIEWSGNTSISASPMRVYLSQDTPDGFTSEGWNKWREESNALFKVELSKRNGKWAFGEIRSLGAHGAGDFKKANCQQIPGAVPSQSKEQGGQNDISQTYGKVGNVIFNKKTLTVFTKPAEFFKDSGKKSFNGLKYDVQSELPAGLKFINGRKLTDEDYSKLR